MGRYKPVRRGGFCAYCKNGPLLASTDRGGMSFTWDHINPKASGGGPKVPCCRRCNEMKGDIHPQEWFWFIDNHPRYRRDFRTCREVKIVIGAEKHRRLLAGESPIAPPVNMFEEEDCG